MSTSPASTATTEGAGDVWQFAGRSNAWYDYAADAGLALDRAYRRGSKSADIEAKGLIVAVDLQAFTQTCGKKTRNVRRVPFLGWQFQTSACWRDFDSDASDRLEAALCADQPLCVFMHGSSRYEIVFSDMRQTRCDDPSRRRRVRRRGGETPLPELVLWRVLIPAFQANFDEFRAPWSRDRTNRAGWPAKTVPSRYVVNNVEKVYHPERWAAYKKALDAVAAACASSSSFALVSVQTRGLNAQLASPEWALRSDCNEVYLFHGSTASSEILEAHFDVSMARPSTASLVGGSKVYFSDIAAKSDEYTGTANQGLRMLLCRAALGVSLYTEEAAPSDATKAEFDRKLASGQYHSVRSFRKSTTGLTEFAIADPNLIYVEWVITYSRVA
mmetsp:Transcript_11784/g.33568  ORF Transcript_11784/g.33568 Transcript_11784/m.33568 type:complete len:387 (+) Transcript_11784:66-1226(+)